MIMIMIMMIIMIMIVVMIINVIVFLLIPVDSLGGRHSAICCLFVRTVSSFKLPESRPQKQT